MTYYIHESFIENITKKLNRIAKKCMKLGAGVKFDIIGEDFIERIDENKNTIVDRFIIIDVEGTAKIDSWECAAVMEICNEGNIIRNINTSIEVPEMFRHCENVCDHCGTARAKKMFIIRNTATGEWKKVGGACLKLFTSGLSMELVAEYMNMVAELENAYIAPAHESTKHYKDVHDVIGLAYMLITKYGYMKKNEEEPMALTTKKLLTNIFFNDCTDGINKMLDYRIFDRFDERDFDKTEVDNAVENIINYYLNVEADSNFISNVQIILKSGYCAYDQLGYLAYLPAGYAKFVAKENAKKTVDNEMSFFGNVGERYKDMAINAFEIAAKWYNDFGVVIVYKFHVNGAVLVWKTGKEIDSASKITFTVKSHDEYKGEKQTTVTRCKVC